MHALPFTVNAVGAASLDVQVPWKPSEVEPPPVHWLVVEYATWQAAPPPPGEVTVQANAAEPDAPVVSVAVVFRKKLWATSSKLNEIF